MTDAEKTPVKDALERARLAYERAGRGCIGSLPTEVPRYATVSELAARLGPEEDMLDALDGDQRGRRAV